MTIVYDGTFPRAYVRVMGPGMPDSQRAHSPEQAASQRRMVRASLEAEHKPDVHRRRYEPGEAEEIAVAAVVREALWKVATRMEGDPTLEQLVDEAAMAAAKVMMRAASSRDNGDGTTTHTFVYPAPDLRVVPEGWRGRLANVERLLDGLPLGIEALTESESADLEAALAEVRSLLDME
jgi:hypothetical protein